MAKNLAQVDFEEEMADILYSLNKKAKNMRDAQKKIVFAKHSKSTKSNKGKFSNKIQEVKDKKNTYYEQKDALLSTYFEPICIHKEVLTIKTYTHLSNMRGVNLEELMKRKLANKFAFNFIEEKYQKKNKQLVAYNRKMNSRCYCFNDIIEDENIIENICLDIQQRYPEILIKGNKIYIPCYLKMSIDDIFIKNLWNGKCLEDNIDYEKVLKFDEIEISRKTFHSDYDTRYYLFYKIDNHSFHKPIDRDDLIKYAHLNIVNVSLNTKGDCEKNLFRDDEIKEKLKELGTH